MERVSFPFTGNSVIMAIVIVTHVFIALIAVGGGALTLIFEWVGYKRKDDDFLRFAKRLSKALSDMMKINGVLGVTFVVLIIGLWGNFGKTLFNIQFWPFVIEGLLFLSLMTIGVIYNRTWEMKSRQKHIYIGIAMVLSSVLAAFMINAIWAFMMTPGDWLQSQSRIDAFFTPILFESFSHLIIPCFANTALLIFLYSYFKERKMTDEKEYYSKINAFSGKIAAVTFLFQPVSGISFLFSVKSASASLNDPTPFSQIISGTATPFFHTMIGLASIGVIFAVVYLMLGHDKGRKFLLITAFAAYLAFPMGAYTREKARKPYLIHSYMPLNMRTADDANASASGMSGQDIWTEWDCISCHTLNGTGGTEGPELLDLADDYEVADLKEFLLDPGDDMPEFDGSDKQLNTLANYLLEVTLSK